jgi:hypothetical protein
MSRKFAPHLVRRGNTLSEGEIRAVAAAAGRAPSVHNTQPWRLHSDGHQLTLSADWSRQLRSTDPSGSELLLSCGAALFNVRVALRHLSRQPRVDLMPDPLEPDLLARIHFGPHAPPTAQEEHWHAAVSRRHTHRGAFLPVPVDQTVLDASQNAARAEGAELFRVESGQNSRTLEAVAEAAERAQQAHPHVRQELTDWTRRPGLVLPGQGRARCGCVACRARFRLGPRPRSVAPTSCSRRITAVHLADGGRPAR